MKTLSIIILLALLPVIPTHAAQDKVTDITAKGNESFTRGEFDKAAILYDKALKIEAKNPVILYNQANVLFQQNKYEEALTKYKEALKNSPPRRLISNIYFNAGNTALKLAALQTKEKEGLDELQKSISYYETSFNMYRKSLAQARAVSIAEGRDVNDTGLSAKKNWALAREFWTAALDKIKTLQKKNMPLEDGIRGLLTAQTNLLPTLEGIFLNSLSKDTLKFNLKRLAEYQLDHKEEISTLRDLAKKQEEETQTKIANLKTTTPAVKPGAKTGATPAPAKGADSPESDELNQQLKTAQEVTKAVQQAAALDEWIVDNLKKNQAMEAWGNANKMVDLLEGLSSYLEGNDPVLKAYHNGIGQLEATKELLRQAKNLAGITDNENAALAGSRRTTLAEAKTAAASAAMTKINFYLKTIAENKEKENAKSPDDSTHPGKDTKTAASSHNEAANTLQTAITNTEKAYLKELQTRNEKLAAGLTEKSGSLGKDGAEIISTELAQYKASLAWYQHLGKSVNQLIATLVKENAGEEDRINALLETTPDQNNKTPHGDIQPGGSDAEEINILLFQLAGIKTSLSDMAETDNGTSENKNLQKMLTKGLKQLKTSWQKEKELRKNLPKKNVEQAHLTNLEDLRLALIRNLLIFSPDMAIALYYERSAELQQHLLELFPAQPEIIATIEQRYQRAVGEAASLNSLLVSYLNSLKKSINAMDGKEKRETYQEALTKRQKAVPFIQRVIDTGQEASSLLAAKKMQEAEILYKNMPGSLQKSRLAFNEQPKEAQKALTLTISLQKKLEEQSRGASEAVTVEGESEALNSATAANQDDISTLSNSTILLLQNMIGMADVPTQGKKPQAKAGEPKKVDTKKIKDAMDKVGEALVKMEKTSAFLKAGEFTNTFTKHQEITTLLQEALDLLKNKDQKKKDKKDKKKDGKKKDDKKQQQKQQQKQKQQNGAGQGKSKPKKPLEMSSQEARELLKQLNKQDEKQQHRAIPSRGRGQINTPRPW